MRRQENKIKSEIVLCLLRLIESGQGLDTQALAADIIAADARLNMWFAGQKRKENERKWSDEEWMELLERYEKPIKECQSSVEKFLEGGDRQELIESLHRVLTQLLWRPAP